jgi:hypothetical protein
VSKPLSGIVAFVLAASVGWSVRASADATEVAPVAPPAAPVPAPLIPAPPPAVAPAPAPLVPAPPPAVVPVAIPRDARHAPPPYVEPGIRLVIGAAPVGSCTRVDSNVGRSGFCTEGFVGLAFTFPLHFHVDIEAGGGWLGASSIGDPTFGVAYASGGPYVALRAMLGTDLTSLFFWRVGAQGRLFTLDALNRANAGAQLVGDLGTRVRRFEFGTRGVLGVDGVNEGGNGGGNSWAPALTYGISLFARYVTP